MSKAEDRALERFPAERGHMHDRPYQREGFIEGYRQAEKDLELTVDDIKNIDRLLNQCVDYSNPYQEVLKRLKKMKYEDNKDTAN